MKVSEMKVSVIDKKSWEYGLELLEKTFEKAIKEIKEVSELMKRLIENEEK